MEFDRARRDLVAALQAGVSEPAADRFRLARLVLLECAAEASGITAPLGLGLPELIRRAAAAGASPKRRDFAVLLVHALAVPGLVFGSRTRNTELERDICRLTETAIASVLLRAGYPFRAGTYEKMRFLARLHTSIDDHLRPFEPTFPPWLNGLDRK